MTTTTDTQSDQTNDPTPMQAIEKMQDDVERVNVLLVRADSLSPRTRELAKQIRDNIDANALLVYELQNIVEHEQLQTELGEIERKRASLDQEKEALDARERELLARLGELDLPAHTAPSPRIEFVEARPAVSAAVEFRQPTEHHAGTPVALTAQDKWDRAVTTYLHDGRVRGWLRLQPDIANDVKSRGPLKREHVERWLTAHPDALDAVKVG